ncbi:MAG: NAD(P)-dependent oxidoreductase [Saprospiraceae bacterium]|nr:NAD(P)-dependent oxidoreductase [Saprospiraceae bacterium]
MKIGLIHEGKIPKDNRVALTPAKCAFVERLFSCKIIVEPSPTRCFSDAEYQAEGITVSTDLSQCDCLMGIKEVPIDRLMAGKTYLFFSHTIKKQAHNRGLLQAVLEKKITLIDYEVLTDDYNQRLMAFGKFAGMVGAHNGILGYGLRTGAFDLPRMRDLESYADARKVYKQTSFPPLSIVVSGGGRVSKGAMEVLLDMGFKKVAPTDFLVEQFDTPVFTQIHPLDYVARKDGEPFEKPDFYRNPTEFRSTFAKFYRRTDVFINCIFFDRRAPMFFTAEQMKQPDFRIKMIADVSCDMMPYSSLPSTIKSTTIDQPFFGFDVFKNAEADNPFAGNAVTMMTIDNLPNELPRDASEYFGEQFIINILPELQAILRGEPSKIIERAMITQKGRLTNKYRYLEDYVQP